MLSASSIGAIQKIALHTQKKDAVVTAPFLL